VDQDILNKGYYIAPVIQGLPLGSPNVFDLKPSSNATKDEGLVKDMDGGGIYVRECIGCRMGASSVNDTSECMGVVPGDVTEELSRGA